MARDTRARMLETTARLLQHRGVHGTALSEVLGESGAPRGSLYFHFPGGKAQLVVEATRATVAEGTRQLREALARAPDPARAVRSFFETTARVLRDTDYTYGCPVAPVILDAADGLEELAEICRAAFEEWVGLVQGAFVRAGIPRRRARALALLVESSLEGSLLIGRAYRDAGPLQTVAAELEAIIESALPRSRTGTPPRRRRRPRG